LEIGIIQSKNLTPARITSSTHSSIEVENQRLRKDR